MEEIFKILAAPFTISKISIENPMAVGSDMTIKIELLTTEQGSRIIEFENVHEINIESRYGGLDFSSPNHSIAIEDLSDCQMEGIKYKVAISENAMTFYCWRIRYA